MVSLLLSISLITQGMVDFLEFVQGYFCCVSWLVFRQVFQHPQEWGLLHQLGFPLVYSFFLQSQGMEHPQ